MYVYVYCIYIIIYNYIYMYKNTDNIHTHVHTALHDVSHCRKKNPGLTEDPGPALLLGSRLGKKIAGQGTIQAVDSIWLVVYLPL